GHQGQGVGQQHSAGHHLQPRAAVSAELHPARQPRADPEGGAFGARRSPSYRGRLALGDPGPPAVVRRAAEIAERAGEALIDRGPQPPAAHAVASGAPPCRVMTPPCGMRTRWRSWYAATPGRCAMLTIVVFGSFRPSSR